VYQELDAEQRAVLVQKVWQRRAAMRAGAPAPDKAAEPMATSKPSAVSP